METNHYFQIFRELILNKVVMRQTSDDGRKHADVRFSIFARSFQKTHYKLVTIWLNLRESVVSCE